MLQLVVGEVLRDGRCQPRDDREGCGGGDAVVATSAIHTVMQRCRACKRVFGIIGCGSRRSSEDCPRAKCVHAAIFPVSRWRPWP